MINPKCGKERLSWMLMVVISLLLVLLPSEDSASALDMDL